MAEKSFNDAMQELERLVATLEKGELPLEEALQAFDQGMQLVKFCSHKLEEAQKKVTLLMEQSDGSHTEIPFGGEDIDDPGGV